MYMYINALRPQNHEKWRFYTPNIWGITPKNEGCGFPWYVNMQLQKTYTRICAYYIYVSINMYVDMYLYIYKGMQYEMMRQRPSDFPSYRLFNRDPYNIL